MISHLLLALDIDHNQSCWLLTIITFSSVCDFCFNPPVPDLCLTTFPDWNLWHRTSFTSSFQLISGLNHTSIGDFHEIWTAETCWRILLITVKLFKMILCTKAGSCWCKGTGYEQWLCTIQKDLKQIQIQSMPITLSSIYISYPTHLDSTWKDSLSQRCVSLGYSQSFWWENSGISPS